MNVFKSFDALFEIFIFANFLTSLLDIHDLVSDNL